MKSVGRHQRKHGLATAAFAIGLVGFIFTLLLLLAVGGRLPAAVQMRVEALPNGEGIARTVALLAGSCALAAIVMAKVSGATLVSGKDRFPASTQGSTTDVVSIAAYLVRSSDLGRAALWLGTFGLVWSIAALVVLGFGGSLP